MKKIVLQMLLIIGIPILSYFFIDSSITQAVLNFISLDINNLIKALEGYSISEEIISVLESVAIGIMLLLVFRKYNKDKIFIKGDKYLEYPIILFYIGSKILGFRKVSLIRMPIYLQFKLIMNDIFEVFETDSNIEIKNQKVYVEEELGDNKSNEINFILNDTYKVRKEGIPEKMHALPYVIISNGKTFDGIRTYNKDFINEVRRQTHKYSKEYSTLNLFPLTNTNHNKEMVETSFKNAGRTGFKYLNIFKHDAKSEKFYKKVKIL